ncbi:HAD hydrolase-like protein [Alteribacillus sp. JSM 102045]
MFQSFIFDVDGTLLDTEKAIFKSLQQALKKQLELTILLTS